MYSNDGTFFYRVRSRCFTQWRRAWRLEAGVEVGGGGRGRWRERGKTYGWIIWGLGV